MVRGKIFKRKFSNQEDLKITLPLTNGFKKNEFPQLKES